MSIRSYIDIINEAHHNAIQKDVLQQLKAEVESGNMPTVNNCSSCPGYTMGDLEALGWMTKTYTHDDAGEVDGWTRDYSGPAPVMVQTQGAPHSQKLNPGETL